MQIRYKSTYLDVLRFNMRHQFSSLMMQCLAGLTFLFIFFTSPEGEGITRAGNLIVSLMWWIAFWVVHFILTAFLMLSPKNKTMFDEHTAEVTAEGFLEETRFNRSLHYWSGIVRVAQRRSHVALYISNDQAHVIPKRFFSSKAQMKEFCVLVEQHIQKSRATATSNG